MTYLYHYHERHTQPFRNLSFLSMEEAKEVLAHLIEANPEYWYVKKYGGFLERRRALEEKARELFISKGGLVASHAPHYLTLGKSDFLKDWFVDPVVVRIPLEAIDIRYISFCYGDIFPTFGKVASNKPYKNQVYTYKEILEVINEFGMPEVTNSNGKACYARYIEAHLWDTRFVDDCIDKYKKGLLDDLYCEC